jgi:hypothetical protein
MISNDQYKRLIAFVNDSFIRGTVGNVINIKTNANYTSADAFYEARQIQHVLHLQHLGQQRPQSLRPNRLHVDTL